MLPVSNCPPDDSTSASSTDPAAEPPSANRKSDHCPVVGVGASLGGLTAFTQLLIHLPSDTGMAFVLVQHLAPTQESHLAELLAGSAQMPVFEVRDGMDIVPNQVYVIPPNAQMTLVQGQLRLTPLAAAQAVQHSIDVFLTSLAEAQGEAAIAVILSGSNADGAQGLADVKAVGGITFAQSSTTAEDDTMPQAAIATGQVDFVLSPAAIAAELVNISHHPYLTTTSTTPPDSPGNPQEVFPQIFALLQNNFGVDFSQYKHTSLQRRILRRMAIHRMEDFASYAAYLEQHPTEVQALYDEILIHVTAFFRDPSVFEVLKRDIFPALMRDRPVESPIRVWVAGCSTGEEAYSIAMDLLEFLDTQLRRPPIQIFATDVSGYAIEKARLGIYPPSQVADLAPERLKRFFVPVDGGYQIIKSVRERCIFARQNLINDPPFSRMDLISCRNVLIYFSSELQKKILPMFHYGLKPQGFLLLGSSETVGDFFNLFHLVDRKHRIYTKQPVALQIPLDLGQGIQYLGETFKSAHFSNTQSIQVNLSEIADQIILKQFTPVGVIVNANLDIVEFRGQIGAYLEPSPGQASLSVLSMVKEELRIELRAAIHEARQQQQAVQKAGILVRDADRTRMIKINVAPIQVSSNNDCYFLILFQDTLLETDGPEDSRADADSNKRRNRQQTEIIRLQHELEATKAHLRSIIEEQQVTNQDLRAANEEILSSNEELQSTNEELQTAKEEIQATNEELSTINEELYRRNVETMQVSNDFQNLFSSIHIPILMLASDLRIRRFTPAATSLFNLIESDVGRPISDINHRLNLPNLEQQILEVINTLETRAQEAQDQDGHWYDLRIRPYRTLDNRIDGAIVVLVEIDDRKRTAAQLQATQQYVEAIAQTLQEPLLVLNAELRVVFANQPFYQLFQLNPGNTERQIIFDLSNGQWNIASLGLRLQALLSSPTQSERFIIEHDFPHIGYKRLHLNTRRVPDDNNETLIIIAIQEIRDRPEDPQATD